MTTATEPTCDKCGNLLIAFEKMGNRCNQCLGARQPLSPKAAAKHIGRMETVLGEIKEYVDNYVDIDWEGRPNWAMDIKVMLEKLS